MFIQNCWYVAGWAHDLEPGVPSALMIIGEPLVIYRKPGGGVVALEDRCVHRLAPLSKGRCEGSNIRCMYHGLLFSPEGECIEIPGQDQIPSKARVRNFPALEKDGWIWIWMGPPDEADQELIPSAISVDDENWHFGTGFLDYEADYQLINDNLTDFSHLSFTHVNSFKAGLNWALSRPKISKLDRGILVERWVENDPVPPYLDGDFNSVDQYVRYEFLAPGILFLSTEIHPGSSSAKYPLGRDRPEPLFATFSAQAVTPVDEKKSRYFFSWGPRRVDGDAQTADVMMQVALRAFAEDKEIIEAQQKIIDCDADRQVMPISADKGVILFQRVMRGLHHSEAPV